MGSGTPPTLASQPQADALSQNPKSEKKTNPTRAAGSLGSTKAALSHLSSGPSHHHPSSSPKQFLVPPGKMGSLEHLCGGPGPFMGRTLCQEPQPCGFPAVQAAWGREHLLVVPTLPLIPSPFSSWSSGNLLCPAPSSKTGPLPLPQAQAFGSPRVFWKLLPAPLPATAQGSFPSSCNDPFAEELGHMGDRNRGRTCFRGQGEVNGAKRGTPAGVLETLLLTSAQLWPILATPRTPAHQAPLSMGFPKQEY